MKIDRAQSQLSADIPMLKVQTVRRHNENKNLFFVFFG